MLHGWTAVLPGLSTILVIIPSVLLLLFRKTQYFHSATRPSKPRFWLAALLGLAGVFLVMRTMSLFVRFGQGTPAPWDPPRRFVVRGPYRYVRNPMMAGFFLILFAEFLFLWSWPLLVWTAVVIIGNLIYMPLVEEKGLEKRFGDEYLAYKRHVPRWIPRLTPWTPSTGKEQ